MVTKRQAHHCIQGWISKYEIERWHSKVPSINPTLIKSPKIFPCHSRHFIFQINFRQDLFLLHSLFLSLSLCIFYHHFPSSAIFLFQFFFTLSSSTVYWRYEQIFCYSHITLPLYKKISLRYKFVQNPGTKQKEIPTSDINQESRDEIKF